MLSDSKSISHSAEGAALGFYYQTIYALLALFEDPNDESSVALERLDDIEITTSEQTLLYQLKHSIQSVPPPITIKSKSFWATMKVWVDLISKVEISNFVLHLVAVGNIPASDPLSGFLQNSPNIDLLMAELEKEANRVVSERSAAKKLKKSLPYEDRALSCEAFLALKSSARRDILMRIRLNPGAPSIDKIEEQISDHSLLSILPIAQRPLLTERLVQWWDRQVVMSLCGLRNRVISKGELQEAITKFISEIELELLTADFEGLLPPNEYDADRMLVRQINLVKGSKTDVSKATREEWRARSQRAKWSTRNPAMTAMIALYDNLLREEWGDRHCQIIEDTSTAPDHIKELKGLELLRWSHDLAPKNIRPISKEWTADYYVRGSFQILSIERQVGWHPDYVCLTEDNQ